MAIDFGRDNIDGDNNGGDDFKVHTNHTVITQDFAIPKRKIQK
ncbi:hypothetical protein AB1K62_06635 [Parasphingorhabdus sp. JC815]